MIFNSTQYHQLDDKGRLRIPSRYREDLGDKPVMMLGAEKCIKIYTREAFDKTIVKKFEAMDPLDPDIDEIKRQLFGNLEDVVEDKQGRVQLPSYFIEKCELKKDIVTVGCCDHIEVWDAGAYKEHGAGVPLGKLLREMSSKAAAQAK